MPDLALEMEGISKSFPGVHALEAVSLDCAAGEVHAICGENGAGKSTLIKILGGVHRPDAGDIRIGGVAMTFPHPRAAQRAGICIVHQELSLLPNRTVAENVFLGHEPLRRGQLDRRAMRDGTRRILERLRSHVDPDTRAGDLSVAAQQLVEIGKALALAPRILVLDEPTAALDDTDASGLLDLVRRLRSEGVAILYVSHRMPEIAAISDRVSVLKDGRKVVTDATRAMPIERLVRSMVGRDLADFFPPRGSGGTEPLLEVEGVGNGVLSKINLTVRRGEILGIAGLEGSGKTALGRVLFGDLSVSCGTMRFLGRPYRPRSARDGLGAGIGFLPDDRKGEGLLLGQSLRDNVALTLRAFAPAFGRPGAKGMANRHLDERMRKLDVRAARFSVAIRTLSGGNQQKVIIARALARDPQLLIFAEPTRGIDVAAKAAIYDIMRDLTARGCAVVVISSDLPEVIGVSDRIIVMHEGRIAGELPGGASEEDVMALAVGHHTRPREGEAV